MRTIRTAKNRTVILDALREGYTEVGACRRAGVGRTAVWSWRNDDPDFAAAYLEAEAAGGRYLEDVARDRAVDHSDTLLIFLLKGRYPDKYKDRVQSQHTGEISVRVVYGDDGSPGASAEADSGTAGVS